MFGFPGSIVMKKVKITTKLEHESIQNFKLFQSCCNKLNVDKVRGGKERIIYRHNVPSLVFATNVTLLQNIGES